MRWCSFLNRLSAIKALIIKEFQIIWSDPKNRIMIILPPIIQLSLFAYAATFEVKNISMIIYDQDKTEISRALTDKLAHTPSVEQIYFVDHPDKLTDLMDRQKAYVALTIPQNFSAKLYAGESPNMQLILDGRKSNTAQIVMGYLTQIIRAFQYEIQGVSVPSSPIQINLRNWFNPNLDYQWFIVISLTGVLAMVMMLSITALSVAQEKELGTFDQIIVSPLKPFEILIGKTIPALVIALMDVSIMIIWGLIVFDIPLEGGWIMLYTIITVFLLSIAGIGLFISTLCQTQQQAILGVFVFLAPTFLLSGFVTPIDNMPLYLQKLSIINPLTYFFSLIKGVFLKDISWAMAWSHIWPLLIIALCTMSFANWFFNKRLD